MKRPGLSRPDWAEVKFQIHGDNWSLVNPGTPRRLQLQLS